MFINRPIKLPDAGDWALNEAKQGLILKVGPRDGPKCPSKRDKSNTNRISLGSPKDVKVAHSPTRQKSTYMSPVGWFDALDDY